MNFIKPKELLTSNSFSLLLYLTHILLNYLQSSFLPMFYILEVLFFFFLAFRKDWKDLLYPTIIFFFIEGQGRILSNYHPIMRNIFDLYLIIILVRSFIKSKKLIDLKTLPLFFNILIILHFAWYIVQVFNFQNLGTTAVIFASKIYIFPILFFYMFLREKLVIQKYDQTKLLIALTIIISAQVFLVFHQMYLQESHLLSISPYYQKVFGEKFIGALFRPFGTSFVPGGISVHFAYISALLIFTRSKRMIYIVVKIALIAAMLFACFTMQVRTSLIQLVLICTLSYLVISIFSKIRWIVIPLIIGIIFSTPTIIGSSKKLSQIFPELNLEYSIQRLQIFNKIGDIQVQRATVGKFYSTLVNKLDKSPMGLGPGRTGAANSMFVDRINSDLLFDMKYSWTLDNLFISLAIDFGYGMIFYSLLVILLPLYVLFRTFIFIVKNRKFYPIPVVCGITTFVILLSNWGAIAIPYNPVSFFFWFYLSIALIELKKLEDSNQALVTHQ